MAAQAHVRAGDQRAITDWDQFIGSLVLDDWKHPDKDVYRTHENGRRLWHKRQPSLAREVMLLSHWLDNSRHLTRVQRMVRIDLANQDLVTEDAGRDLHTWLWHCAKPADTVEQKMWVRRSGHETKREHILNWDDTLLRFVAGALETLDGVHESGVVHFDIHLANWCFEPLNPRPGKAHDRVLLNCRLQLDQPHLIDFSESICQSRFPLACVPRHVRVMLDPGTHELRENASRMSPAFYRVAKLAHECAAQTVPHFEAWPKELQWRRLSDSEWCRISGIDAVIAELLTCHLDWREDLFQLGYMLRQLMGERREDGAVHGHDLSNGMRPEHLHRRLLAPLPAAAALNDDDRILRARLNRLPDDLAAFALDEGPPPATRPHRKLAADLRALLEAQHYHSHEAIDFEFIGEGHAAPPQRALQPPGASESWKPPALRPFMVVPKGSHRVGISSRLREVQLPDDLAVGRDPVTVLEFAAFVAALPARRRKPYWVIPVNDASLPITHVTRQDAEAYVQWLTAEIARPRAWAPFRLLTAVEWEIACRAGSARDYCLQTPMDDITRAHAIYRSSQRNRAGLHWGRLLDMVAPAPVDHPHNQINPYGLRGMHGNVWEMASRRDDPARTEIRGGCFASPPWDLTAHHAESIADSHESSCIGFRICRTLDPKESS